MATTDSEHVALIGSLVNTFNTTARTSTDLHAVFSYESGAMLLEIKFKNEALFHVDSSNIPISQASTIVATALSAFVAGQKYQVLK